MGFGYLFLGYLVAFLLSLTAGALGVKSLALIGGFLLMLIGISRLSRYHGAFALSKWLLIPMLLVALYWLFADIEALFLLPIPFVGGTVEAVVGWVDFVLTVLFQCALLYAIRMLADSIELKKISAAALRNTLFVGIYAMLYVASNLSLEETVAAYVTLFANLLNLLWVVCIAWLLVNCMKCIGSEGEEDAPPSRSRFAWVNRLNDAYDRTHEKLNEQARADGEALMRRHQEKKKNRSKKKK